MKKLLFPLLMLISFACFSQVNPGTFTPKNYSSIFDTDSTFLCRGWTYVQYFAIGNPGEYAEVTMLDPVSLNSMGTFPVVVGVLYNVPNNSKVMGNHDVDLGTLSQVIIGGDTLAPRVFCYAWK